MIDDARAILEHVPALNSKAALISQLGGGMTNRIYKIDIPSPLPAAGEGSGVRGSAASSRAPFSIPCRRAPPK